MYDGQHLDEMSGDELSEPQVRAIAAMVGGKTMAEAAEHAGVSRSTLYRWHDDERFVEALESAKRDHRAAVRSELCSLASVAVGVLRNVMETQLTIPGLRVKVAMDVLRAVGVDQPGEAFSGSCEKRSS
jgi:hypothetical protein